MTSSLADESGYDLTVRVSGLRNDSGMSQVSLYNKEGSIPDKHF